MGQTDDPHSYCTVTVVLAELEIAGDAVSLPTTVTVYFPAATFFGLVLFVDELPPPQAGIESAKAAKNSTSSVLRSFRGPHAKTPPNNIPPSARPTGTRCDPGLGPWFSSARKVVPPLCRLADPPQALVLVFNVKVAVTLAAVETVAFGTLKQPFVKGGTLVTVQEIEPV